jgi:hypothetical protein
LINQNEQPQIAPRAKKDTFQGIIIPCAVLMPILFPTGGYFFHSLRLGVAMGV